MFELSGLDKYHVEEEMLRRQLSGVSGNIVKRIQTKGQWPLGTSGQLAFEEKQSEVEFFINLVHEQQMGAQCPDRPIDLAVGNYHLYGTLSNLYENGIMLIRFGKLRGRDLLSGWIHHLVLSRLMPSAKTRIVAVDCIIGFSDAVGSGYLPGLDMLLTHFDEGCRAPSQFFIEPAFTYAKQLANTRARTSPLDKALQTLQTRLENGYEPEWKLLFGNSGASAQDAIVIPEFERFCQEIMFRIWSAVDE
jgi:exodeoxyribonuclease V gamma subunit